MKLFLKTNIERKQSIEIRYHVGPDQQTLATPILRHFSAHSTQPLATSPLAISTRKDRTEILQGS